MMRLCVAVVALIAAVSAPRAIELDENAPAHTTAGRIRLPATRSAVAEVLTAFDRWPAMFSDVVWIRVESREPARPRIRYKSKSLQQELLLQFDNALPDRIRFTIVDGPAGLIGWGSTTLAEDGGSTRVEATLFIHVPAWDDLPLSRALVDRVREQKFKRDADDLVNHFARTPQTAGPRRAFPFIP